MSSNSNDNSIDTMLYELDKIFKFYYLGYKNHEEPYEKIIKKIKKYKNTSKCEDLLIAIQNKIDSKETFLNLELNMWGILFVIIGVFVTIVSNLILNNYDKLNFLNQISSDFYVAFTIIFVMILIILHCFSIKSITERNKKNVSIKWYIIFYHLKIEK